ncbi:MAG: hypothetical protein CM1200mP1_10210 [Candidatus Neomarinimicrobiota bacterium]|nr:MAG: hypothetical protein CM1200mP1_10210 [Candidatus Neomarinimicrobiota bacterium]
MYGQMTAGSWIYIGTQGICKAPTKLLLQQLTNYNSDLTGKLVLTAGLGGMGGAQPLAVKMNNGVSICVEVDKDRIQKRLDTKYLDIFY